MKHSAAAVFLFWKQQRLLSLLKLRVVEKSEDETRRVSGDRKC